MKLKYLFFVLIVFPFSLLAQKITCSDVKGLEVGTLNSVPPGYTGKIKICSGNVLRIVADCTNGLKDGECIWYNSDGSVKSKGQFIKGVRQLPSKKEEEFYTYYLEFTVDSCEYSIPFELRSYETLEAIRKWKIQCPGMLGKPPSGSGIEGLAMLIHSWSQHPPTKDQISLVADCSINGAVRKLGLVFRIEEIGNCK